MAVSEPYLSLVIPCYNEQENVEELLRRVSGSLEQTGKPFEVILVDDGSTDKTPELLEAAKAKYPWLRVMRMKQNRGQSAAFEAGFEAAKTAEAAVRWAYGQYDRLRGERPLTSPWCWRPR